MLCMDYVWIYMAHTSILMGQPLTRMHPYGTGTKPHRNQIRTRPVGIHNILLIFWEKRDSFISLVAQFDYTMLHRFIISKYPGPGVNPHFFQQEKNMERVPCHGHLPIGRLQQLGHHQVLVVWSSRLCHSFFARNTWDFDGSSGDQSINGVTS